MVRKDNVIKVVMRSSSFMKSKNGNNANLLLLHKP